MFRMHCSVVHAPLSWPVDRPPRPLAVENETRRNRHGAARRCSGTENEQVGIEAAPFRGENAHSLLIGDKCLCCILDMCSSWSRESAITGARLASGRDSTSSAYYVSFELCEPGLLSTMVTAFMLISLYCGGYLRRLSFFF